MSTSYHPSLMGSSSHSCTLNYCSFVHSKRFRYNLCRRHWVACWEHEDEEHWIPLSLTSISLYSTEGEGVGMANTWRDDHRTLGFAGSTSCFHNFKESLPLPMEEGHLYFQKLLPAVLWTMIRGDTESVGLPGQWGGWKTVAGESWWGIQQREVQQGQSGNNGGRSMKRSYEEHTALGGWPAGVRRHRKNCCSWWAQWLLRLEPGTLEVSWIICRAQSPLQMQTLTS